MKTIPHYCQSCGSLNRLGERDCRNCGSQLMLVVFPPSSRHDESIVPSFYEDHLLERVTLLEIRLSQVSERLATALELMFRQTKSAHSDRLLIETIIESLNTLGTVEKDKLESDWLKKLGYNKEKKTKAEKNEELFERISKHKANPSGAMFLNLVKEGLHLLSKGEDRQAMKNLERASLMSPENKVLLFFMAQTNFCNDKHEAAEIYTEKYLSIEPENAAMNLLSAIIKADLFKFEQAEKKVEKLLENSSQSFAVNYLLAMISVSKNNLKDALNYFKAALSVKETAEVRYLTGCTYYQTGKHKFALKHIRRAVEIDPDYADAWFMISKIFEATGEESMALQAAEIAGNKREQGAQCREFLYRNNRKFNAALPFMRLQNNSGNLLTGGAPRLSKFFKDEVCKILETDE